MTPSRSTRRRPGRVVVLLTALTVAAAVGLPTSGALAARPGTVTADEITATVNGLDLPDDAPGAPTALVAAGTEFSVTAALVSAGAAASYSANQDTELTLAVTAGTSRLVSASGDPLTAAPRAVVPAGEDTATFQGCDWCRPRSTCS